MQEAYALEKDRLSGENVQKIHAIFSSLTNIVNREVTHTNRNDKIFVSCFGLNTAKTVVNTCDLIALLQHIHDAFNELNWINPYKKLMEMADEQPQVQHLIGSLENWIRKCLSRIEALYLYKVLQSDPKRLRDLANKLPGAREEVDEDSQEFARPESSSTLFRVLSLVSNPIASLTELHAKARTKAIGVAAALVEPDAEKVRSSEAFKYAEKLIEKYIQKRLIDEHPKSVKVQKALELLQDVSRKSGRISQTDVIDSIEPYIYGRTPMCEAMRKAFDIFKRSSAEKKILFILSDGLSTDGDPREIARKHAATNVTIVTCYLTSEHIQFPRSLFDQASFHDRGKINLFDMSSTMSNMDPPVSFLVDAGWRLPPSGESKLFVQANSLEVVDELCRIVVSRLADPCDALLDIIGKVDLAIYINQKKC